MDSVTQAVGQSKAQVVRAFSSSKASTEMGHSLGQGSSGMGRKARMLFVGSMQYPQAAGSWTLVVLNPGGWGTWQIKRTGSHPETQSPMLRT